MSSSPGLGDLKGPEGLASEFQQPGVLLFMTFSVSHLFIHSPCLTHEQFGEMFVQPEVLTDHSDLHLLELKHIHEVEAWRFFV